MRKKYLVRLSLEERLQCEHVVDKLKGASQKVRRANILLKADADGPACTDSRVAEAFRCRIQTVENIRKRFVLEGFETALERVSDHLPRGMRTGRCGSWRARWWHWRSSSPSVTKPSGGR